MNDLTLPPDGSAKGVALVLQQLAEPQRVMAQLRPWLTQVQFNRIWPWPLERAAEFRDRALERHQTMPSGKQLCDDQEVLIAAANGATDEPKTRWLIGQMLCAMPAATKFDSATYITALVYVLMWKDEDQGEPECFSPSVVAAAVLETLRNDTFVPAISEFAARCKKHRLALCEAIEGLNRLIELRDNCEDILLETGDYVVGRCPACKHGGLIRAGRPRDAVVKCRECGHAAPMSQVMLPDMDDEIDL
jgi:hypothetical protein